MDKEIVTTFPGRGGARPGAGRKKGSKSSKNTTVFYASCTEDEKQQLREFLNKLRGLVVIFGIILFFANPCFAFNVEYPTNIPSDIHIKIEPGFVYAGGIYKQNVRTPNSFKISAYRTENIQYRFAMKDAKIIIDDVEYLLIEPTSYYYLYNNSEIPTISIFKGQNNTFPFYVAPLENLFYNKSLDSYIEPVKASFIASYIFPIKFNNKQSVLKDKTICFIKLPLYNIDSHETHNLIFRITL